MKFFFFALLALQANLRGLKKKNLISVETINIYISLTPSLYFFIAARGKLSVFHQNETELSFTMQPTRGEMWTKTLASSYRSSSCLALRSAEQIRLRRTKSDAD